MICYLKIIVSLLLLGEKKKKSKKNKKAMRRSSSHNEDDSNSDTSSNNFGDRRKSAYQKQHKEKYPKNDYSSSEKKYRDRKRRSRSRSNSPYQRDSRSKPSHRQDGHCTQIQPYLGLYGNYVIQMKLENSFASPLAIQMLKHKLIVCTRKIPCLYKHYI